MGTKVPSKKGLSNMLSMVVSERDVLWSEFRGK